jgi:hypothetical protein
MEVEGKDRIRKTYGRITKGFNLKHKLVLMNFFDINQNISSDKIRLWCNIKMLNYNYISQIHLTRRFIMEDIIKLQRVTIDEHVRAEIAKEWDAVYETFVQNENAFYDVVPLGTRFPGIKGVHDFYSVIHAALPDFTILITGEYDTPGCSIREVTIAGTHLGEYGGIPASNNHIALEVACFFIFDPKNPGKLLAERVYFDNESLLRQCRGETSIPTKIGLVEMSHSFN